MNCIPTVAKDGRIICTECGRIYPRGATVDSVAICKTDQHIGTQPIRLGTKIKQGLDALGITQERVAALVGAIGLPPSCLGCAKRQESIDEFDRKARLWLAKAAKWFNG